MTRKFCFKWFLMVGLMMASSPAVSQSSHFTLEKLADGVYAAVHKTGGEAISNAGVVDLGDETVIFDTFYSPHAAAELEEEIRALGLSPVRWVFNSHFHDDHTRGNQVFTKEATIISTGLTREAVSNNMPRQLEADRQSAAARLAEKKNRLASAANALERGREQFWVDYYQAQANTVPILDPTPPDHTVDGRMVLHGSRRSVVFVDSGPGHSDSNAILFVSPDSVLFAGGTVYSGLHPNMLRSHPEEWIQNLQRLKLLGARTVVPGHGPTGTSALLEEMIQYIDDLSAIAVDVVLTDSTGTSTVDVSIPSEYENWLLPEFFAMNVGHLIERVRSRISNRPPDSPRQ